MKALTLLTLLICFQMANVSRADDEIPGLLPTLRKLDNDWNKLGNSYPWTGASLDLKRDWLDALTAMSGLAVAAEYGATGYVRQILPKAIYKFRRAGFNMSWANDDAGRAEMNTTKYLVYLSELENFLPLVENYREPLLWVKGNTVWMYLPKRMGYRAAFDTCEQQMFPGTAGWHLPLVKEHSAQGVFKNLNSSIMNPSFGSKIQKWEDVWTSTPSSSQQGSYETIDFTRYQSTPAGILTPHYVICAGRLN